LRRYSHQSGPDPLVAKEVPVLGDEAMGRIRPHIEPALAGEWLRSGRRCVSVHGEPRLAVKVACRTSS